MWFFSTLIARLKRLVAMIRQDAQHSAAEMSFEPPPRAYRRARLKPKPGEKTDIRF
jgi:hypothetical protein